MRGAPWLLSWALDYSIVRPSKDMEEDKRLKRLLFQSQHRGFNEMDQLLTAFARAELSALTPTEITDYETLLELPDWDIFSWLVGQAPPPADMENIVARIRKHMDRK